MVLILNILQNNSFSFEWNRNFPLFVFVYKIIVDFDLLVYQFVNYLIGSINILGFLIY